MSNFSVFALDNNQFVDFCETCKIAPVISDLYNDELGKLKHNDRVKNDVNKLISRLGFEWDLLAECGHMRFKPYATTMLELMKQYIWSMVTSFCSTNRIPLQRISGGELYSLERNEIKRHLELVEHSVMYGDDMLTVSGGDNRQLLRFSGCSNKLASLKSVNLTKQMLPLGIFEISKSYRFEKKESLNCCERVRCFHLPELHIVTKALDESLLYLRLAHSFIIEHIRALKYDFVLMCTATKTFINENREFIQWLSENVKHQILFFIDEKNETCENGIQFDVEYKAITSYNGYLEIATLQVDSGNSDFSYGITYDGRNPVSTIHAVFFASLERAIYAIAERATCSEGNLPLWLAPVQCRIVLKTSLKGACIDKIVADFESVGIRYEIDDREILYEEKIKDARALAVPYIILIEDGAVRIINSKNENCLNCTDEIVYANRQIGNQFLNIPQFFPKTLSQQLFL